MRVTIPAIDAKNLTYVRNGERLFSDFTFSIKPGSYTAVIGPNGGGKTTLLKVLLGLLSPTAGQVRIFGKSATSTEARRRIGYVPQRGGLIELTFPATSEEVVNAGRTQVLGLWRRFGAADARAVDRAFDIMNIEHLRRRTIGSLSGGERQRVLLARALASNADILALDEPVDGLDPESREEFYGALRRINKEGKTVLFVTHDVHRLSKEADSAICLRHELICQEEKACWVSGAKLRNLFHPSKSELHEHHGG